MHRFPWASLLCLAVSFAERNTSITTSQKIESGYYFHAQSSIQRNDFRLCRTVREKFASCTSNWWGTNVRLPKIHKTPLPRLTLKPQSRQQSPSLGINPVDNAEPCYPHDNIVGIHLCCECTKPILPIVCHMPESILWLLLHICWQTTRMSGLPIRARYKHFKTICEHACDSSPTDSSSSCLNWWSSKQRLETLKNCSTFLFANVTASINAFSSMSFDIAGQAPYWLQSLSKQGVVTAVKVRTENNKADAGTKPVSRDTHKHWRGRTSWQPGRETGTTNWWTTLRSSASSWSMHVVSTHWASFIRMQQQSGFVVTRQPTLWVVRCLMPCVTVLTAVDVRCSVMQPNTSRKFVRSGDYPNVPSKNQQGVEKVRSL